MVYLDDSLGLIFGFRTSDSGFTLLAFFAPRTCFGLRCAIDAEGVEG